MSNNTLDEIEKVLEAAESSVPMLSGILMMIPGANAVVPFLQLIPVAIEAVKAIQGAIPGTSQAGAITVLRSHMTQGMPNAAALGTNAPSASTLGSG